MIGEDLKKQGKAYGYVIALAGLAVIAVSYGVVLNCFSLYIKPVTKEFGFSRQSFSLCLSIINIVLMLISVASGKIFRRFGIHRLMKIAAVAVPAAYYAFSLCTRLWMFYIVSAAIGLFTSLLSMLPFAVIISNWFEEHRGLAIGICFMGSGVGGMLFNALGGMWLVSHSWQWVARVIAAIMLLVLVPLVYFVILVQPNTKAPTANNSAWVYTDNGSAPSGVTLHEAVHGWKFWSMTAMALILGFVTCTLSTTVVTHISDIGFNSVYAANLCAVCLGMMAAGKVLLGYMFDKLGIVRSTAISIVSVIIGIIGLTFGQFSLCHLLIVFGCAIGNPVSTVGYPGLIRETFGERGYADINGVINSASFFGVSISPLFTNTIYDDTGTYAGAYFAAMAAALVALLLLWTMSSRKSYKA